MGNSQSQPNDTPGPNEPGLPTTTPPVDPSQPVGAGVSGSLSDSMSPSASGDPSLSLSTTSTLSTDSTTSLPSVTATVNPLGTTTTDTETAATLIGQGSADTKPNGDGVSVVGIVVPVVLISALLGAVGAIFFMRRRRRQESRRHLEDFQRRNSNYDFSTTRPYAPGQHATYSPPSAFGGDGTTTYEASVYSGVMPANPYGGVAGGYPALVMQQQQQAMYPVVHPGWAPPHPESDAQSFASLTTTGFASFAAHPLSPQPPMPPATWAAAQVAVPMVETLAPPAPVLAAAESGALHRASVRSIGTVASVDERRELRITNALSTATLAPALPMSPTSPSKATSPTGKPGAELGEDTLTAWMKN